MKIRTLLLKWSVSRGRTTYGYNIVTLTDTSNQKKYSCNGGGYDMTGTVFGQWLKETYQEWLLENKGEICSMYGARYNEENNYVYLAGACGLECMVEIARKIDLEVHRFWDKDGRTLGWAIVDKAAT